MRDHVSQPYKTTGKVVVLHVLCNFFLFFRQQTEIQNIPHRFLASTSQNEAPLDIFSNIIFKLRFLPRYLNGALFSNDPLNYEYLVFLRIYFQIS
jgi:hypothetical protein